MEIPPRFGKSVRKMLRRNFGECWGYYGDQRRVLALATAIEFLREAAELAENYSVLINKVYHSSTLDGSVPIRLLRKVS